LGLGDHDRFLQFAAPCFDVAVEEIFPTLINGAAVVVRDRSDLVPPENLLRVVKEDRVTAMELPTGYWHQLVAELSTANVHSLDSLRLMIIAGEKVVASRLARWQVFGKRVIHVYGLTEATVSSTFYDVPENTDAQVVEAGLPVGRPLANTQIYVLDDNLQPVPPSVRGDLYIGGDSLARGYHEPASTAEKFIPNPFSHEPGKRLCKTGDLALFLPDGNVRFLGRRDRQISHRGFRIEPAEIEMTLKQHAGIVDAVVILEGETSQTSPMTDNSVERENEALWRTLLDLPDELAEQALVQVEGLSEEEAESMVVQEAASRLEQRTRKVRRLRDFDVELSLHNDHFIKPPTESQRDWLLRRALDEFVADLNSLDLLASRMVPGSGRPPIRGPWDKSDAQYAPSELIVQGQQVMQDWERPLMKAMATVVTETHGDVLEFGFGMGISASYIQEMGVRSHTIVELNDKVVEHFEQWRSQFPDRDIRLIHADWHDAVEQLGKYDGVFFDTVPDSEERYAKEVVDSIVMAEEVFPLAASCLRPGGIFTWYTNEIDSFSRRHQRLVFKYFSSLSLNVVRSLLPPEDCHYWWADSMVVAKAIK
ncbi:MAG TPA: AMP-binding protein, partial [Pyrinomonadaceae bacterium]|nr:AMP-binding protein [Pyrinomonadaceae bacterium]